jgi:hypothetical protein
MAMIDPEKERRRLAEFYANQLDGELEKVAAEAYELTEMARQALQAELTRRSIRVAFVERRPGPPPPEPTYGDPPPETPPVEATPGAEIEMRRMVTIRQFRDLPEALLAQGSLDSAGIDSALVDANIVRLDWFWSNLVGGVKLQVDPDEVDSANEILNQPIPEDFDATGTGSYEQPHCPSCQSLEISFQELNKPVAYVSMYFGLPLPLRRQAWRCQSCSAEWEDDGLPGPAEPAN